MKHLARHFLILTLGLVALFRPALAADPGPLVDTTWLRAQLGRPELLLLDASMTPVYRKGHIPGAVSADLFSLGPRELPDAALQPRLQAWGLGPERLVVLYDGGGSYEATRVHFELLHRGFPPERLRVLDGGLAKWRADGGAVTAEATPAPTPGSFRIVQRREDVRVRLEEFLAASADPEQHALVEALDADWHFGGAPFFHRSGHVPNAIMLPPEDFFRADKTFKAPDEIARMLAHLGVRREQQVLAHCGGGWAATVPFFALRELLGWPRVRVFQESQLGWLRDPRELPMWTYDAPQRLRDTAWVRTWAGRRFRSFGIDEAAIVDVRPAAAYAQGHLPFAVSLPAAEVRALDPAALAARLGALGLNPAHELVVAGDGGLTPDAALVAVALERAGVPRVSVFVDSPDRWVELGQELVRGEAPAARPASYPQRTAPAASRGLYPQRRVHFGPRAPGDGAPHLPAATLLQPDGRPLPAHALWTALQKAGVTRYAALLATGDSAGDAEQGYLLLKLVGLPDVSVSAPASRP